MVATVIVSHSWPLEPFHKLLARILTYAVVITIKFIFACETQMQLFMEFLQLFNIFPSKLIHMTQGCCYCCRPPYNLNWTRYNEDCKYSNQQFVHLNKLLMQKKLEKLSVKLEFLHWFMVVSYRSDLFSDHRLLEKYNFHLTL